MTADDISGRNSRTGTKSGKCCKKKGRIGMEAAKSAANEEMQEISIRITFIWLQGTGW